MERFTENKRVAPLLEALEYGPHSPAIYQDTHALYAAYLLKQYQQLLIHLGASQHPLATQLQEAARLAGGEPTLQKVLQYPECSSRLLFAIDKEATAAFLEKALTVHHNLEVGKFEASKGVYLWNVLGDALLIYDQESGEYARFDSPSLGECLPIDFMSPYCRKIGHADISESEEASIDCYGMEELGPLVERMEGALAPMEKLNPSIKQLILEFTQVVIALKIQENGEPNGYMSSSNGWQIGRTILGNMELMTQEVLAESLLHEAIHALLYMVDIKHPWMPSLEESAHLGNVVPSNWTGNRIPIRSYSQALFVWYGLYRFYEQAAAAGLYQKDRVTQRMAFIKKGFATVNLAEMETTYDLQFDHELKAVVETMLERLNIKAPLVTI